MRSRVRYMRARVYIQDKRGSGSGLQTARDDTRQQSSGQEGTVDNEDRFSKHFEGRSPSFARRSYVTTNSQYYDKESIPQKWCANP